MKLQLKSQTFTWTVLLSLILMGLSLTAGEGDKASKKAIKKAVNHSARTAENKVRDAHRHPLETLAFFGVQPNMTVVEVYPGGGWYTEILAPLLNDKGQYIAAGYDRESDSEWVQKAVKRFDEKLASHADYSKAKTTELSFPKKTAIAPPGSADMVLTFRNTHSMMRGGNLEAGFKAFYTALKPGGILGVVQHRGTGEGEQDPKASKGYVNEAFVIAMAEKAGFKLAAKSDVNANPRDTKDYEGGVWTLPPRLRLGDEDKDKYTAIGESDRMTLKFVKP